MGLVIYLLEERLSFFIIIPISVILYAAVLMLVKGFTVSEIKGFIRLLLRNLNRFPWKKHFLLP